MRHPARTYRFGHLMDLLTREVEAGTVNVSVDHEAGISLFCYSKTCVYDRAWNKTNEMARGLIMDWRNETIVATPFPKFFNVSEKPDAIPDLPFEVFEKLDGSMITLFWHRGAWRTATKGSFRSDQAAWAQEFIRHYDLSVLNQGTTYLCEAIYPENRIVIQYKQAGLVLLAAYDPLGFELTYDDLDGLSRRLGWPVAARMPMAAISDLLAAARCLPATAEGWVLRFEDGHRLKVKGDEYLRLHRMISRLTPLSVWEAMMNGDDLISYRKELPEEFWPDFDAIFGKLCHQAAQIALDTKKALEDAYQGQHLTNKEVGLMIDKFPFHVRPFIFQYREHGNLMQGRCRQTLFRAIRPTGNKLEGYVPSGSVTRVFDEAG